jgi:two-component system, sensor histidine kinase and response regulator
MQTVDSEHLVITQTKNMPLTHVSTGTRVLLISPDKSPIGNVLRLLEHSQYRVHHVAAGENALHHIEKFGTDIVLYDQHTPDYKPEAFIQRVRILPKGVEVPVILMGEEDSVVPWRKALNMGALDYFPYSICRLHYERVLQTAGDRQRIQAAQIRKHVEQHHHEIIGIVQHEFRTPLTLLLGYAEYLRESLVGEISREELELSIEAILSGSERLHRLIESFLLLAELRQRHSQPANHQCMDPVLLWQEAHAILRVEVEKSGLIVEYDEPKQLQPVDLDSGLVREALTRLLDNALRYRQANSRRIRLCVHYTLDAVEWSIEDDGQGIAETQLQRILQPFGRVEKDRYTPQGIGLSLAIVQRVAELHNGKLHVESQPGKGSTFTLRLPLAGKQERSSRTFYN